MSTLSDNATFTEGVNTDEIGTSAPSASTVGFQPEAGQTGFFVHTPSVPYTLWFKSASGWSVHQQFTSSDLLQATAFAWGSNTAAYIQTATSGHVIRIFPRTGSIIVDSNPSDTDMTRDTLVQGAVVTPLNVVTPSGTGGATTMGGTMTSHIIPDTNAAYDLGNAEYKIRHLFLSDNSMYIGDTWIKAEGDSVKMENLLVGDLNLNNTGRQNEVDGTSGHWSIQEGSEDLFLINRTTGKKYRFNITEVEES